MKKVLLTILAVLIIIPTLCITSFADSAGISVNASNVTVGKNVTVNISYNSSMSLYVVSGKLTYNSSVLRYVSGGASVSGSTISLYKDLNGETRTSFSLVFQSIAEGTSSLGVSLDGSDGSTKGSASSNSVVTVSKPAPSANANLASLSISNAAISPAFNPNVTAYSASVANNIDTVSIKANPAVGGSNIIGLGDKKLNEGDNSFVITVTAPSGAKKTYTINIRRRLAGEKTVEEMLTTTVNDTTKKVVQNISALPVLPGFSQTTTTYNSQEVGVLVDKNSKYTVYYLTDEDGQNVSYYLLNDKNEFEPLPYIQSGEKIYIVSTPPTSLSVPDDFIENKYTLNDIKYPAFTYKDAKMSDIYILYCYDGENYGFYSYDAQFGTLQRYPIFENEKVEPVIAKSSFMGKLKALPTLTKILFIFVFVLFVAVIVLLVLLLKKKKTNKNFIDFDKSLSLEDEISDGFVINTDTDFDE